MVKRSIIYRALTPLSMALITYFALSPISLAAAPTSSGPILNSAALANSTGVPNITLSASSGYVGDSIKVTGSGFAPGQIVTFSIDGSSILSYITGWDSRVQVMTDTTGSFSPAGTFGAAQCSVPNLPGGMHTVTAQDESGNTASASITIIPRITLSQLAGPAGTLLKAAGTGLRANARVDISFNSKTVQGASANTDALGSFTQAFAVPDLPGGNYNVEVSDGTTTAGFTFAIQIGRASCRERV
jgi:hypothetical protein